jgi:hypothetical protein
MGYISGLPMVALPISRLPPVALIEPGVIV